MDEELKILFPDRNDKVVSRMFDTQVVFGAFCWLKKGMRQKTPSHAFLLSYF
jgi:hypothetical protein